MKINCPNCNYGWETSPAQGQRLEMCPECGNIIPVESLEKASEKSATGTQAVRELTSVPFLLEDRQPAQEETPEVPPQSRPVISSRSGRSGRRAVMLLDLYQFRQLTEGMKPERVKEITTIAKRIIRYGLGQFDGTELHGSQGFLLLFDRPIDAVAYALNLQETLAKVSREMGLPLQGQAAIDVGDVTVEPPAEGRRKPLATGLALERVKSLILMARGAQTYLTREAYDAARQSAGGNDSIPPSTQWLRRGRFAMQGQSEPIEVCEVGRPGLAPLGPPGKQRLSDPSATANVVNAGSSLRMAMQFGAAQISASFRRAPEIAPSAPRTAEGAYAQSLPGTFVGQYLVDSLKREQDGELYYIGRNNYLEQDVLLKVLPPAEAKDHVKLSRFLREGLTCVHLQHPNILHAFDMGADEDKHYIAFEMVHGNSLGEIVQAVGPLQVRVALGYALQTARALQYAHSYGVIHRNVQPENLLLSPQGIVKLAEFGLAKVRGKEIRQLVEKESDSKPVLRMAMTSVTSTNVALGQVEFIAPEQAEDARSVDEAADQYALGCTLFYLCTGRPPFEGHTGEEVQDSRSSQGLRPLSQFVRDVSFEVDRFIARLLHEDSHKRFADMGEVVQQLELLLGVHTPRQVAPSPTDVRKPDLEAPAPAAAPAVSVEEQTAEELRSLQKVYYRTGFAKLRALALWLFFLGVPAAAAAVFVYRNDFQAAGAVGGLFIIAPLMNILVGGIINRTPLFLRLRHVVLNTSLSGWVISTIGAVGVLGFLFLIGLLHWWAGVAVLAAILAVAYQLLVAVPLRLQRAPAVHRADELLRGLRGEGYSEQALREMVFRTSPKHWEEFYETIFGYDEKMRARWSWANGVTGRKRPRFAAWRDPLMRALVGIQRDRQYRRQHQALMKAELKRLELEGKAGEDIERQAFVKALHMMREEQELAEFMERAAEGAGAGIFTPEKGYGDPWKMARTTAGAKADLSRRGGLRKLLKLCCFLFGIFLIVGFVLPLTGIGAGQPVIDFLKEDYLKWGFGGHWITILIGVLLLKNATWTRYFPALSAVGGAALVVFTQPIVVMVDRTHFTVIVAQYCGFILLALGLGLLHRLYRLGPFARMSGV